MASNKQKVLAKKVMENYGKEPLGKLMVESGYTKASAKNPKLITESVGYQEEIKPFLQELEDSRDECIKKLKVEMPKAKFGEVSQHLDRVVKNIELLSGRNTERAGITITTINYGETDNNTT